MFKLNEKYEINRNIIKYDCIRYSPSELSTINTAISQIYINIATEDSVLFLLICYIDLNFDVLHAASNDRYGDGNDSRLVNLGPIASFSNFKLTTSSGKLLEDISRAHVVSLMQKIITSRRDSDDLSIGFDRDRFRGQRALTNNRKIKGKNYIRIMFKDKFGSVENQEKATYGLSYKLVLTGNFDDAVLNEANANHCR